MKELALLSPLLLSVLLLPSELPTSAGQTLNLIVKTLCEGYFLGQFLYPRHKYGLLVRHFLGMHPSLL